MFGLLTRGGRVYTLPIPNANQSQDFVPILESRVVPDSVVYTDSFADYDVMGVSRFHHVRISHEKPSVGGLGNRSHINGTLKLLGPGEATSTQIQRHSAQALLLLLRGNGNGASMEGATKGITVGCWGGLGGGERTLTNTCKME